MRMPGVQKPHCRAWWRLNACCSAFSTPASARPSTVRISVPSHSTAYCTHQPCLSCSKLLISVGVLKLVYETPYPDAIAMNLLAEAGVASVHFATLEGAHT